MPDKTLNSTAPKRTKIGRARSGKETGMALPDLLRVGRQRSLCVIDPKADLAAAAQLAEAMIPVNPDSKEPPWGESARSLLAAVFIWHQLHPEKE